MSLLSRAAYSHLLKNFNANVRTKIKQTLRTSQLIFQIETVMEEIWYYFYMIYVVLPIYDS